MTGRLESLVYTDCLPGESLTGNAGLGFLAASPGAGRDARDVTRSHLLYEPPAEWMRRQRPVEDYPKSLAHIHTDGWYATAAGTYLGKEAKGNRQGNHLTHAVLSNDPDTYDLVRPAQLAGAGFWLTAAIPSGEAPGIGPDWEPGGTDAEAVAGFVREQPDGPDRLAALRSALVAPDERRVLFIGADPEEILTWIAAATLLLPRHEALRVGFKVFTTRPAHGAHRIVAVHPDWLPTGLSTSQPQGMHVFDLRDGSHSPIETDPESPRWAELFCGEDAEDVVDSIELAAESKLDPSAARSLAAAAFFGHTPPLAAATQLAGWLRQCSPDRHAAYGESVTRALLACDDPPHELLLELDALAAADRLPGNAARVRLRLFELECGLVAGSPANLTEDRRRLPDGDWGPADEERALTMLTAALDRSPSHRFHAVLRLAHRFRLPLDPGRDLPRTAADDFVEWWAANPDAEPDPATGPAGDVLRDRLHDALAKRCGGTDDARLGSLWHRRALAWFDRPDLDDPLYRTVLAADQAESDPDSRVQQAERVLASVVPADAHRASEVLWRWCDLDFADLSLLSRYLPAGERLPSRWLGPVRERLLHQRDALRRSQLELVRTLLDQGLIADTELAELIDMDRRMQTLAREPGSVEELDTAADYLANVPQLLRLHESTVIDALLATRATRASVLLARRLSRSGQDTYAERLIPRMRPLRSSRDAFCAYAVISRGAASGQTLRKLQNSLNSAIRSAEPKLLAAAVARADEVSAKFGDGMHGYVTKQAQSGGQVRRTITKIFKKR